MTKRSIAKRASRRIGVVIGRVLVLMSVLSLAVPVSPSPSGAYYDFSWTSANCVGTTGWANYSVGAKQASSAISNTSVTCYTGAHALCQRANGGVKWYRSAGNTVSQGVSTYDCDNNGTYNVALTNNGWRALTTDFSSGAF
jgi:hypothetical protein